ncbi:MAG: prolipoprotein diacylglyceryl transferase [Spirochaetota bacterium]
MLEYIMYPDWISPTVLPGLPIRWYGITYLLGFITAYILFRHEMRRRKPEVDGETIVDFFFWGIVGILIGGRVLATLVYADTLHYLTQPWLIFWPFNENMEFTGLQGMSYHGGVLGAAAAIIIYGYRKKIQFMEWADILACAAPLGYTFGRLGNFINGELYGRVTTAPWGMVFPNARPISVEHEWARNVASDIGMDVEAHTQFLNLPRHPSQLYEAFFEGIFLWVLLWFVFRKRRLFRGALVGIYLFGYAFVRFFIEYVRQPDPGLDFVVRLSSKYNPPELFVTPLNLTMGQVLSIIMMIVAAVFLWFMYRRHDNRPTVQTLKPDQKGSPPKSKS